jgi:hypothetical protein
MADESDRKEGSEVDRLFDATVRRMLKTPPKPHEQMKLGRPRRRSREIGSEEKGQYVDRREAFE